MDSSKWWKDVEAETDKIICALRAYYRREILNEEADFICEYEGACRRSCKGGQNFHEAQLGFMGRYYALKRKGRDYRVMVVGISRGGEASRQGLHKLSSHEAGDARTRGTVEALRILFEGLDPSIENVLDGYFLTNAMLCSITKGKSAPEIGEPTPRVENCSKHLLETIKIAKPNIIISQGQEPRDAIWHLINNGKDLSCAFDLNNIGQTYPYFKDYHILKLPIENEDHCVAYFECPHPSARGRSAHLGWSSANSKFFKENLNFRLRKFVNRFDAGTAFDPDYF